MKKGPCACRGFSLPRVGETSSRHSSKEKRGNFNPLPPCEGRRIGRRECFSDRIISIHSPRVGETVAYWRCVCDCGFQSTPPVWGETKPSVPKVTIQSFQSTPLVWGGDHRAEVFALVAGISIHSPVWGGDQKDSCPCTVPAYINPLPPCEGRRQGLQNRNRLLHFNPLPRVRGDILRCAC